VKDAQEIFKDRPEAAKKLIEAVMKACSGCKLPIKQEDDRPKPTKTIATESPPQKKMDPILKQMMKILTGIRQKKSVRVIKTKIIINLYPSILQPTRLLKISQKRKIRSSKRKT